eukprot:jgi/Chrzof1/13368/Cz07g30130.t1
MQLYTPVAPTPECLEHLSSLQGQVQHIVIPNSFAEHYCYAPAMADCFPEACIWVCPGVLNGETPGSTKEINQSIAALKSNLRVQEIGPAFTQAVGPDVDYAMYEQPLAKFREVVLHVKSLKAVMFSDLAFGAFNDEGLIIPVISKWNAQLVGVYKRLGAPLGFLMMQLNKQAAKAWASKVLSWDFDTVCSGHLTPAIAEGKTEFRRCFAFLGL